MTQQETANVQPKIPMLYTVNDIIFELGKALIEKANAERCYIQLLKQNKRMSERISELEAMLSANNKGINNGAP